MDFSHAFVATVPNTLTFANKKTIFDTSPLRRQSEGIIETLREAGLVVNEHCLDDGAPVSALLIGDAAVSICGTTFLCRPRNPGISHIELRCILSAYCCSIEECPDVVDGKTVVLDGGDVFFTGREIFVGVRKHGTNFEGAKAVARVFCDHVVIPIHMSDKAQCLKYYVAVVAPDILAIGTSREGQHILKVIEMEATLRYKIIPVEDDQGVNCILVNERLIFLRSKTAAKFIALQSNLLELWTLDVADLLRFGLPLARHCLLTKAMSTTKIFNTQQLNNG
ncbi:hypothetical protein Angca_006965 [Angiostrongylus cantonensis]|nr:hypothetical protein Angca_006965 [Angiostrongylus cantonensis]